MKKDMSKQPSSHSSYSPDEVGRIKRQLETLKHNKQQAQRSKEQQRVGPSQLNVLSLRIRRTQLTEVLSVREGAANERAFLSIRDGYISGSGGNVRMEKGPTMQGTISVDGGIAVGLTQILKAPSVKDSTIDLRVLIKQHHFLLTGDKGFSISAPMKYDSRTFRQPLLERMSGLKIL